MSRSGYRDDLDDFDLGRWRASVYRAMHGKRGQAFLREMLTAFDALPDKALIASELIDESGNCCAIGAVCKARKLDVSKIDESDPEDVAGAVGIARSMAAEIAYVNDECGPTRWSPEWTGSAETPAQRFSRVRAWVERQIEGAKVRP